MAGHPTLTVHGERMSLKWAISIAVFGLIPLAAGVILLACAPTAVPATTTPTHAIREPIVNRRTMMIPKKLLRALMRSLFSPR